MHTRVIKMKAMVRSSDGNIDFFDIVARVLQENTFTSYLYIISLDFVQQMSIDLIKGNGFSLKEIQEVDDIAQKLWQTQTTQVV